MSLVRKTAFMLLVAGSAVCVSWCLKMTKSPVPNTSMLSVSKGSLPEATSSKIERFFALNKTKNSLLWADPNLQLLGVVAGEGQRGVGLVKGESARPIVLSSGATYQEKWKVVSLGKKSMTLVLIDQSSTEDSHKVVITCCGGKSMPGQTVGNGK